MKRTSRNISSVYATSRNDATTSSSPAAAVASPRPAVPSDSDLLRNIANQMCSFTESVAAANRSCDETRELINAQLDEHRQLIQQGRRDTLADAKALFANLQQQYKTLAPDFTWKGKGNEAQHVWNTTVLSTLLEAATCLESDDFEGAKRFIQKGMKDVVFRNKLIKLADGSPAGWGLVEEYMRKDLAKDDNDDRKIRRCETAALEKKRRRIEESGKKSKGGNANKGGKGKANTTVIADADEPLLDQFPCNLFAQAARNLMNPGAHAVSNQAHPKKLGPCYTCAGPHLQNACPFARNQQAALQAQLAANLANAPGNSKS
jgi:hypothetical protein